MIKSFLICLIFLLSKFGFSQSFDLCDPLLKLKIDGTGYSYIEWYIDGEFSGNDENLIIQLSDTGLINITVIAYNDVLCEVKVTKNIKIEPCKECLLYIPNAVTPNFDNINDKWEPISNCEYKFEIYNRWGELIYFGPPAWSANVQNDVYVYRIMSNNKVYIGRITVIR
jgi:hypothetical protein